MPTCVTIIWILFLGLVASKCCRFRWKTFIVDCWELDVCFILVCFVLNFLVNYFVLFYQSNLLSVWNFSWNGWSELVFLWWFTLRLSFLNDFFFFFRRPNSVLTYTFSLDWSLIIFFYFLQEKPCNGSGSIRKLIMIKQFIVVVFFCFGQQIRNTVILRYIYKNNNPNVNWILRV